MFYCDLGLFDPVEAINKDLALKSAIAYIKRRIRSFDSCYTVALEFVKFYENEINGRVTHFTVWEIREIAKLGAEVCLSRKKCSKMDIEEITKNYSLVYEYIYYEIVEKYKDIILKVDTQAEKSVQRVKVKRVSAKNARK